MVQVSGKRPWPIQFARFHTAVHAAAGEQFIWNGHLSRFTLDLRWP